MTTGKREGGIEQNEQFRDDKFMEIAKFCHAFFQIVFIVGIANSGIIYITCYFKSVVWVDVKKLIAYPKPFD